MPEIIVDIVRHVGATQPPSVECRLKDAWGNDHIFINKLPIFTEADLNEDSSYPQRGVITFGVVRRWQDPQGREVVTINTSNPWQIESVTGRTQFDVLISELTGL